MESAANRAKVEPTNAHTDADRARVLLEINNAIVSHLDLVKVLKSVSECLRREIKHDIASLALYDAERNELRLHALEFPANADFLKEGQLIPFEGTPAGLVFKTRKPVLRHRPDFDEFPAEIMKRAYAQGIRSGCAVPLLCHDKIVGTMMVASMQESAFTENDVELLTQIGAQVAIAVDNALNYGRLQRAESEIARERDRVQLLLEINNAVVSHLDLHDLLKAISTSLRRIIPHDASCFSLLNAEDGRMHLQAMDSHALERVPFVEGVSTSPEGTPEGEAIRSGRAVLVVPEIDLQRFHNPMVRAASEHGVRSGCAVPLIAHGRTLGALSVLSCERGAFDEDDAKLLEQCSSQIAIAVENALNFEIARTAEREARQERDRSGLLLDINNALVSHLDLSDLVKAVSTSLKSVLPHDCIGLAILDAESGKMISRAVSSALQPIHEGVYFTPAGTMAGLALKTGQPVYAPRQDPVQFPSPATKGYYDRGFQTFYAVPLKVHGGTLGVITVSALKEDAFAEDKLELFREVAMQVAIAVANGIAVSELHRLKDKLAQEKLYLEDEIRSELNFEEIIGQSAALREVLRLVETVASSDSTVLLLGETGTGKELIARAVHDHSRRKARTFVKMNCAAIPTGLLESELFGHEKGAFTGAIAQKIGRLELADQGTLFLDEVGDIPPEIQPKLLRALQEREFERLGSTHTRKVNIRLVAATNRDLQKMTETKEFRSDLYYRLNVFPIRIPPLRERPDDVPLLVRYFAEKFARQMQKPIQTIPAESMRRLQQHDWPGNVRELENLIERAVILTTGAELQVPIPEIKGAVAPVTTAHTDDPERDTIIKVLRETRGMLGGPNGAAARLGMKRTTLQYRIKKLNIQQDEWWITAA